MYVRTKDSVYEVKEKSTGFYIVLFEKVLTHTILNEDVIKESEDLKELCDEFVDDTYKDFYNIKKENGKTFVWSMKQRFKYWNSIDFNFVGTIYGAIYTDKGLIYVAKMNESGDLELI